MVKKVEKPDFNSIGLTGDELMIQIVNLQTENMVFRKKIAVMGEFINKHFPDEDAKEIADVVDTQDIVNTNGSTTKKGRPKKMEETLNV